MRNKVLIYSAIIFASTLVVYWYSFFQLLKSETYFFFWRTHVIGQLEWWQFFASPSGYAPGDTWLFRPLLYVIDALRQTWFGTNYTYWHIFGLGLHLLACFCLFRLLWRFKPGILAFAVTLMFSLSSVLVGAVLYEDINGYQLFVALMLTAFYYAYEYVQNGNNKHLWISFICAVVSCFVYEVGLLVIFVLIAYLALQKKRGWGIYLVFLPFYILIYFVSNIGNPVFNHEVNIIMNQNYVLMGLQNAFVIGVRWFCEIVLPNSFTLTPLPEIRYQPVSFGDAFDDVALLTNVGLFVDLIILGVVVYGIVSAKNRSNIWVYLLGGLAVTYLLIISILRSSVLGEGYITSTNFDTYLLIALLMVILYFWIRNLTGRLKYIVLVALLIFAGINGYKVFNVNQQLSQLEIPEKEYLAQVEQFVELHKNEPNFTFHSQASDIVESQLTMSFIYKDKLTDFTVPEIVYYQYWSENPKYNLVFDGDKLCLK